MTHQRIVPSLVFAAAAFAASSSQASLMNGDFSGTNPFEGWTGLVSDCDDNCDNDVDVDVTSPDDFSTWSANFGTPANGNITLSTTWESTQTWGVQLSQVFTVPEITMGTSGLRLEMVLGFVPSNNQLEFGVAQITDPNDNNALLLDLLAGDRDLTAYAGQQVEMLFRIEDSDGPKDSMTLGNISIERVPAPAPLLLMAVGLGVLGLRRTR